MCPTQTYHNINRQKNIVHLNLISLLIFIQRFFGVLPLMCVVKATRSCVDSVLPKLFPTSINIVLELLQDGK